MQPIVKGLTVDFRRADFTFSRAQFLHRAPAANDRATMVQGAGLPATCPR